MAGISGLDNNIFFGTSAQGVSTLFGSLGTPKGVNSLSNVISDYSSLKTGSYGKLLKAYYGKQDSSTKKTDSAKSAVDKKTTALKNSFSDIKSKATSLSNAAAKLTNTDSSSSLFEKKLIQKAEGGAEEGYDVDKIYSAVDGFVSSYNSAIDSTADSDVQSITSGARSMASTTQVFAKRLAEVGITTDIDGQLKLDEKKFRSADMDKVKSLFNGTNSYAGNISSTAQRITGTTSNKLSSLSTATTAWQYGKQGQYATADYSSLFNSFS